MLAHPTRKAASCGAGLAGRCRRRTHRAGDELAAPAGGDEQPAQQLGERTPVRREPSSASIDCSPRMELGLEPSAERSGRGSKPPTPSLGSVEINVKARPTRTSPGATVSGSSTTYI